MIDFGVSLIDLKVLQWSKVDKIVHSVRNTSSWGCRVWGYKTIETRDIHTEKTISINPLNIETISKGTYSEWLQMYNESNEPLFQSRTEIESRCICTHSCLFIRMVSGETHMVKDIV